MKKSIAVTITLFLFFNLGMLLADDLISFEGNTKYRIVEENENVLNIHLQHKKYQFVPDPSILFSEAKILLNRLGQKLSEERNKQMLPIQDSDITDLDSKRSILSGKTTVKLNANIHFADSTENHSNKPLKNEDVMKLIQAGLGEDLIIARVRASSNVFVLEPDAIILLKQNGVSERIITAMLESPNK